MKYKDYKDLVKIAEDNNFYVTSTTGDSHNSGSKHYLGLAIDVRTKDKTAKQVEDFIKLLRSENLIVRDERIRPPGQRVWNGAHLHIEIPSNKKSAIVRETVLKLGSQGEAVKTLQNRLVKVGFLNPQDIDGDFGVITKSAVVDFQKLYGIAADGVFGTESKMKLASALARL